jgi:hypothetical protein
MRRRIAIGATCVALSASFGGAAVGGAVASDGPQADSAISKRKCKKLLRKIERAAENGNVEKAARLQERFLNKGCAEKLSG